MIAYDVLNNIALWGELYSYYDSEKKRIFDIIDEIKKRDTTKNPLFLLDRGYPSFELMYQLSANKQNYLIRASSNSLKEINEVTQDDKKITITRKEKKITQDDLADAVSVTRQTIISLENGKYNASLQLAHKISKYFNMKIEDVFIFEEE